MRHTLRQLGQLSASAALTTGKSNRSADFRRSLVVHREPHLVMKELWPNLWLGPVASASDLSLLHSCGITHILIAANEQQPQFPTHFTYQSFPLEDTTAQKLGPYLVPACQYIDKALAEGGTVLVHCRAGVSRSASIVVAYVMKAGQMSLKETITMMQGKGACIGPNPSFLNELKQWEREVVGVAREQQEHYQCSNCELHLFAAENLHPHSTDLNPGLDHCEHLFLIRLEGTEVACEGKILLCNRCRGPLGDTEIFCMCGKAVLPSFRIDKTRINAIPLRYHPLLLA